jgi:tetratricopeptide (TPR) repeat protein
VNALLRLAILVLVLAPFGKVRAQDPSVVFNDAVAHYQRGHFDSAAAGFTRIVQGGIDDPRVWYNLGNSHFKSGHIGASLIAYRRGMRLAPRDADLVANYRYARLFAADKIEPVGELFISKWWRVLVDRISINEARWIAALVFWLAACATVWRFWPDQSRRAAFPMWVVGAIWAIWLLATGASATCYARDVVSKDGFVIATQSDVRGGPGNEYTLQFVAHDGLAGTIERTESGWHLVRFPNGLKGWLQTGAFETL